MANDLTVELLRALLSYDPETGTLTWRVNRSNVKAGDVAGANSFVDGYRSITVANRKYLCHRLAWLYVHGRWPLAELDHINRDRTDNRIANLREATKSENMRNAPRKRTNTSGYKGVYWSPQHKKWRAQIWANKKRVCLGLYDDAEEASDAYQSAAKRHFGEFAPSL